MRGRIDAQPTAPSKGSPPPPGDNSQADEDAFASRLISLIQMHHGVDSRIATHKLTGKELATERKEVRRKLADLGYPNDLVDELLEDLTTSRRNHKARETIRARMRAVYDLPIGNVANQPDLFDVAKPKTPLEWEAEGFAAGVKGIARDGVKDVPEDMRVHVDKGWMAGQEKLAWALSEQGINPERPKGNLFDHDLADPDPAPAGEDDGDGDETDDEPAVPE